MIIRIMLLFEILTVLVVLHSFKRKKIQLDIKTIVLIMAHIIFLEIVNTYELNAGYSFIIYLLYIAYSVWEFKSSLFQAIKYTVFCAIQITIVQFIWMILLSFDSFINQDLLGLWVNILTFLSSVLIAMLVKRRHKKAVAKKKNPVVYLAIVFAAMLVFFILFQIKILGYLQAEMFVFAVVAVIFMIIFIEWYELYQVKCEELKKELEVQSGFSVFYQDLIKRVRIRQHNINNQIAAILGTHYVSKTYEELVKSQEKYCGEIMQSNKFNSLLWLGNNVLAGFLYKKFTEMEQREYDINYKASVQDLKLDVQMQYLIEILGILLDNAAEALAQEAYVRQIIVNIYDLQEEYVFEIKNPYRYVSFSEIEEWFCFGKSNKGNERGIGLYRVKEICNEQNCRISCNNSEEKNTNWIVFRLSVKKAGNS